MLMRVQLKRHGYQVPEVAHGMQALQIWAK